MLHIPFQFSCMQVGYPQNSQIAKSPTFVPTFILRWESLGYRNNQRMRAEKDALEKAIATNLISEEFLLKECFRVAAIEL